MTAHEYGVTVAIATPVGLMPYAVITALPGRVRVWLAAEEELDAHSPEWAEFQARLADAMRAAGVGVPA